MPDYRLFALQADGDVVSPPEEFFATSDETAINFAARSPGAHGSALWTHNRFVALVAAGEPETHPGKRRPKRLRRAR